MVKSGGKYFFIKETKGKQAEPKLDLGSDVVFSSMHHSPCLFRGVPQIVYFPN